MVKRDKNGRLMKGSVLNPAGMKQGTTSFATKWKRFIERVAEEEEKTPREINEQLYDTAFREAKGGDYNFYRDIQDRVHGKPVQPTDITSGGEAIAIPSEVMGKYDITRNSEDSSEKPSEVQGGKLRKKVGKDDSGD